MRVSFYFKIAFMVLALAGVFLLMRNLDSGKVEQKLTDPNNTLGMLLGTNQKVMNWCPPSTSLIRLLDSRGSELKTFTSATEISSLCEILVESFDSTDVDGKSFAARLSAHNVRGDKKLLEQIPERPLFRVLGLPFKSDMLLKTLAGHAQP